MKLSEKDLRQMLYWMVLGRRFEERKMVLHRQGRIRGHLHPGQGQEAVHIGTCYGLREGDYITLSHRGKEPELIKGYSLKEMMAGQMCKKEGAGEGRTPTGSHMYGDLSKGIIPSPGIIGSIIPVAAGVGLGLKMEKKGGVVVCIFGDGATNRGDFHEGLNLSAALHLPVIFVVANNGLAISMQIERATGGLSHSIGEADMGRIDEPFDMQCADQFRSGNIASLKKFLDAHIEEGGNGDLAFSHGHVLE